MGKWIMHWVAPSEKDTDTAALGKRLWDAADQFRANSAMSEGQAGGEFYAPSSIVRLLTKFIEPYHGRILDPACGSASAR